jgi:SepF-like predicted cell division protein (DUF552 family)
MPLNLFHKKKETKQETLAVPTQDTPSAENAPEEPKPKAEVIEQEANQPTQKLTETNVPTPLQEPATPAEQQEKTTEQQNEAKPEAPTKTYLKAMPLKDLADLEDIKKEVKNGNIIILRITPLASKNIEDVKVAVNDLFQFAESISGDIARLGEERIVVCPKTVRIWREKTPAPVTSSSEPLPTAA